MAELGIIKGGLVEEPTLSGGIKIDRDAKSVGHPDAVAVQVTDIIGDAHEQCPLLVSDTRGTPALRGDKSEGLDLDSRQGERGTRRCDRGLFPI